MRAAFLAILVAGFGLAGCKSDGKEEKPKVALTSEVDPIATGSVRGGGRDDVRSGISDEAKSWARERGIALPASDHLPYCHGFGCEFKTTIPFGEADIAHLKKIFDGHKASPADERVAINLADQWWEKKADSVIGAPPDHRGSELKDAHKPGQTDCIDEATNTTTLLTWLEGNGLLRHHRVRRPESRGAFLYAHATAVMTDKTTDIDWVADSWMRDSGDRIDIMPLEKWFSLAYVDPTD
ncbi:hypothetical protein [Pinisolibacter sp.]|uniref:hypothetical protein n=1 Tax=Pinisolibacter sp. TaxID=2172024 RepID=UPI002FDCE52D